MAGTVKRHKRCANFTKTEIDLLLDVVLTFKNIVENKKTDASTWKDKKDAWIKITNHFNANSGNFPKSAKTVKAKYESIKKTLRKKCALLRRKQIKPGGRISESDDLDNFEEKLLSMTAYSILGMPSRLDNDNKVAEPVPPKEEWEQDGDDESDCEDIFQSTTETWNVGDYNEHIADLTTAKENNDAIDLLSESQIKEKKSADLCESPKTSKLIHQKIKSPESKKNHESHEELLTIKKAVLLLQKECMEQEKKHKEIVHELVIENLKLDAEIKKAELRRLQKDLDL